MSHYKNHTVLSNLVTLLCCTMISDIEKRSVIHFLYLRGIPAEQMLVQLNEAYHDEAPARSTVYKWIREFRSGRTSIEAEDRPGRPSEIGDQVLERLKAIVTEERRITKQRLSELLNISYGSVHNRLKEIGLRKLSSRFVPYFLSAEMCSRRLDSCLRNIELHEELGDRLLKNIITEDETPLSLYVPDSKRASMEWKFPGERATRKLRSGTSHRRILMLTIFWDHKGVIKMDFADRDTKITGEYYAQLVTETRKLRRKPSGGDLYLLHDNAPIHTSGRAQSSLQSAGFVQLPHPPYSPDLAPSDFFLFSHLKKHLRGKKFFGKEELKEEVANFFTERPENWFASAFDELVRRWKLCIDNNGAYVEK